MNSRLKLSVVVISTCLVCLLLAGAVLGKDNTTSREGVYRHLGVYTEVLSRIKSDYVEEPNMASVTLGALNGLLESVDPFASYLNAEQYKEYVKNKDAYKGDVGIVLSKKYGYVGIVDVVPGSPAAKAGLTTGDMIESIKGVSTRDMPLAYAGQLLKGQPGTPVELSVLAIRHPEAKKISLTRAVTQYPQVTHKMLPDGIGYIEVESLVPGRVGEVATAISDLQKQSPRKIILDLRHCATGSADEGVSLANLFMDKGLITYLQGQRVPRKNFDADPAKTAWKQPIVVITNRGTAAGAEVAAAALLDAKKAEVVGERTYGDAAVRQPITMDDGGAIILSVAKYYSPDGKAIQDTGVTPSVLVAETEPGPDVDEEGKPLPEETQPAKPTEDNLLKRAIEVAKGNVQARGNNSGTAANPVQNPTPQTPLHIPQQ